MPQDGEEIQVIGSTPKMICHVFESEEVQWPKSTVWKFQDFSVIHILREINFGEFRSSKNAVFAIFGSSEFG